MELFMSIVCMLASVALYVAGGFITDIKDGTKLIMASALFAIASAIFLK